MTSSDKSQNVSWKVYVINAQPKLFWMPEFTNSGSQADWQMDIGKKDVHKDRQVDGKKT